MDANEHPLVQRKAFFKNKNENKCSNFPLVVEFASRNLGGLSQNQSTEYVDRVRNRSFNSKRIKKFTPGVLAPFHHVNTLCNSRQLMKTKIDYYYIHVPLLYYSVYAGDCQSSMLISNMGILEIPKVGAEKIFLQIHSVYTSSMESRYRSGENYVGGKKNTKYKKNRNIFRDVSSFSEDYTASAWKQGNIDLFQQNEKLGRWYDPTNVRQNFQGSKSLPERNLSWADNCKICEILRNQSFTENNAGSLATLSTEETEPLPGQPESLFYNLYGSKKDTEDQRKILNMDNEEKHIYDGLYIDDFNYCDFEDDVEQGNFLMKSKFPPRPKFVPEIIKMRTDIEAVFMPEADLSSFDNYVDGAVLQSTNFLTDIRQPVIKNEFAIDRKWTNPYYDGRYLNYDKTFPLFLQRSRVLRLRNRLSLFQQQRNTKNCYSPFETSSGIELSGIIFPISSQANLL